MIPSRVILENYYLENRVEHAKSALQKIALKFTG